MFKSRITPEMHYDDWAQQYDSDVKGWGYHAPARIAGRTNGLIKAMPHSPEILDLGIGTGLLSRKCKTMRPDARITGVDISAKMLDLCDRHNVAHELYRLDVSKDKMPFEENRFDITAASGLMENIENIKFVMAEMSRVTRPGGTVVFTYMPTTRHPCRESLAKKLRTGRTEDGRLVLGDLNLFRHNPENVKLLGKLNGLAMEKGERFVGYRTYVVMAVTYDLFAGRKVRGLQ
jgi:predicted TPR repeat methyltransferase